MSAEPSSSDRLDPRAWKIIGVVIIAPFMTQMDSTIVNVSLSSIRDDLHSTTSIAQWIITGYLLALALMLPLNAWLVDRVGVKRLYLFCFSAFTFASFLCGAAHTVGTLIAARILQGAAGGLMTPLTQLMMTRVAGKQFVKVAGYAAVPILLAPLLGPPRAGIILKYASWRWLFYVNLPIGVIAVLLAAVVIPHDESMLQKRPFDLLGFLTLAPGLSCFLFGFERFSHHQGSSFLIAGIFLILCFLWIAREKKERALIDLELFKIRTFSVASVTQFLSMGIMYCGQFLVPLYLISGAGLSPANAGWVLSAMGIGMLCVYPMMGHFDRQIWLPCGVVQRGIRQLFGNSPFSLDGTHSVFHAGCYCGPGFTRNGTRSDRASLDRRGLRFGAEGEAQFCNGLNEHRSKIRWSDSHYGVGRGGLLLCSSPLCPRGALV